MKKGIFIPNQHKSGGYHWYLENPKGIAEEQEVDKKAKEFATRHPKLARKSK